MIVNGNREVFNEFVLLCSLFLDYGYGFLPASHVLDKQEIVIFVLYSSMIIRIRIARLSSWMSDGVIIEMFPRALIRRIALNLVLATC